MSKAHVNCEFIGGSPTTYSQPMKVALTVNDFLSRAERVYPDRIAVVDEPDQPAESWGAITYREMAERARWLQVWMPSAFSRANALRWSATTRRAC